MSQEVRDAVAMLEGWTKVAVGIRYERIGGDISSTATWLQEVLCEPYRWKHKDGRLPLSVDHPIPDTLDACAKAWDDHAREHGYRWTRSDMAYILWKGMCQWVDQVCDTGTSAASELRDRRELLGLVLKARGVL